jgi:two-component system, cell cycle sensor histidine kinase and response regulator CckA
VPAVRAEPAQSPRIRLKSGLIDLLPEPLERSYLPVPDDRQALEAQLSELVSNLATARRENERFRELLDNAEDVIWRLDLGTLRCVYVSPSVERLTGFSPAEAMQRTLAMMLTEASYSEATRALADDLERYQRSGEARARVIEVEQRKKDGSTRWVRVNACLVFDAAGRPIEIQGISHDIQERKRAEEALRESESRYRRLVESSPDLIMLHDGHKILFVNPAGARLLGAATPEELVGLRLPLGIPCTGQASPLPDAKAVPLVETTVARLDGKLLEVELSAVSILYRNSPATQLVMRDVSDRKRLKQRLEFSDRLSSLGTLAAGAAHEINNPLASLSATLEFLGEELSRMEPAPVGMAEIEQALSEARSSAGRIGRIVRDLKTFAGADEDSLKAIDVRALMESMIVLAGNEIRHRAVLKRSFEDVPRVMANEARLGGVFLSLIMNAVEATPEVGGAGHTIEIMIYPGADEVIVEVRDNGVGIAPELRQRVFEPFFTTKDVGKGLGLGLSVAHAVVASLGGELSLESEVGRGSTFRVRLPSGQIAASLPPASRLVQKSQTQRRGRVLVVDDDPAVGNSLRRLLRDHQVVVERSGAAALRRLFDDEPYDVVLCDLMMPEVSGIDVYERIVEKSPEYSGRIVFVTGGAFTPRAREFLRRSSAPHLDKPFEAESVRRLVRSLIEGGVTRRGGERDTSR